MQLKGSGLSHVFDEANDACIDILIGDAWPFFKNEYLEKMSKETPNSKPSKSPALPPKVNPKGGLPSFRD